MKVQVEFFDLDLSDTTREAFELELRLTLEENYVEDIKVTILDEDNGTLIRGP